MVQRVHNTRYNHIGASSSHNLTSRDSIPNSSPSSGSFVGQLLEFQFRDQLEASLVFLHTKLRAKTDPCQLSSFGSHPSLCGKSHLLLSHHLQSVQRPSPSLISQYSFSESNPYSTRGRGVVPAPSHLKLSRFETVL